jgi:hypothetical protein
MTAGIIGVIPRTVISSAIYMIMFIYNAFVSKFNSYDTRHVCTEKKEASSSCAMKMNTRELYTVN